MNFESFFLNRAAIAVATVLAAMAVPASAQTISAVVTSTGMGIGTNSPTSALQVNGSSYITNRTVPTAGAGLETFYNTTSGFSYQLSYDRSAAQYKPLYFDGSAHNFMINGAGPYLSINSSGNVGIDTTTSWGGLRVDPTGRVGTGPANGTLSAPFSVAGDGGGTTVAMRVERGNGNTARLELNYYSIQKYDGAGNVNDLILQQAGGNVGIGTTAPLGKLHIAGGNVILDNGYGVAWRDTGGGAQAGYIHFDAGNNFRFETNANYQMYFDTNGTGGYHFRTGAGTTERLTVMDSGNVGIGTTSPGYKLQVAGSVRASSFIADSNTYADFVFEPGYKLASLNEVEASIHRHGHLPDIPSAAEAKEHGIDMAAMQVKLLQKIEELTLHQIEQEKSIHSLQAEIQSLKGASLK